SQQPQPGGNYPEAVLGFVSKGAAEAADRGCGSGYAEQIHPDILDHGSFQPDGPQAYLLLYDFFRVYRPVQGAGRSPGAGGEVHRAQHRSAAPADHHDHQFPGRREEAGEAENGPARSAVDQVQNGESGTAAGTGTGERFADDHDSDAVDESE